MSTFNPLPPALIIIIIIIIIISSSRSVIAIVSPVGSWLIKNVTFINFKSEGKPSALKIMTLIKFCVLLTYRFLKYGQKRVLLKKMMYFLYYESSQTYPFCPEQSYTSSCQSCKQRLMKTKTKNEGKYLVPPNR